LDFLILGLPAEFIFELGDEETNNLTDFSKTTTAIFPDYLSSKRSYNNFDLKPVILEREDGQHNSVSISYTVNSKNASTLNVVGLSYQNSRYVLTTKKCTVNRFSIYDSLNASMAILKDATDSGNISIVEINETRIQEDRLLSNMDLRKYVNKQADLPEKSYIAPSIWSYQSFGLESNLSVFEVADLIIGDEVLLYASMFYREAVLCVKDEIGLPEDYLNSRYNKPLSISEAVKLEGALHGFYKVVEVIYGGVLAKDSSRILKIFGSFKVDLNQIVQNPFVGQKEKAIDKVIKLRTLRNQRAAHGKVISNRISTYTELYDNQLLALHILKWTIKAKYKVDIHARFNLDRLIDKQ
jgi:hypothetical protein